MSRERDSRSRKRRKIISVCISFLISLCTTLILVSVLLKGGLINQQLFKQTLSESTYYDSKLEDISATVGDILSSAGFPADISTDVITRTLITLDVNKAMRGNDSDNVEFSEEIKEKLVAYLMENDIPVTESVTESIERLSLEITKVYETHMTLLFVKMYKEFCTRYDDIINIIMYVSVAVLLLCMIIVMLLYTRKYRAMRYIAYGLLSGALMTEAISYISQKSLVNMLSDRHTEYYNVMISFVEKSFSQGIYMCFGGIMLFCLVVLISVYMKKQLI